MQFTPLDKKRRAEWRQMLKSADPAQIGIAAVLFLASALALVLCTWQTVAGVYLLFAAAFYYMLTHSLGAILAVAVPGMALYGVSVLVPSLPHPFLMPAVYTALVLGGVGGGFLILQCREKKYLPLLALPAVAYAVIAVAVGPLQGLWVLVPVALSLVIGFGMRCCCPQTPVLLMISAVLAGAGVATFLSWYGLCGWPQLNPFAYLGTLMHNGFSNVFDTITQVYAQQGIEFAISETDVYNLSALLGNILPGLFLSACGVLSFIIYRVNLRLLTGWGTLTRVPLRIGAMTVSPIAAGLFIVAYLAGSLAGGNLFGTVCENLLLALQPALILVGITSLLAGNPNRSRVSFFTLIILALLLLNYPTLALTAAAFLGAVRILIAAVMNAREKKNGGRK